MTPLRALLDLALEDERRSTGRGKADIARAAGVHPTTLSQHREPDAATLAAVLDHLGRDFVLSEIHSSKPGSPPCSESSIRPARAKKARIPQ